MSALVLRESIMAAINAWSAGVGGSYMATLWAALRKKTTDGHVGALRQFHKWSRERPREESWTARGSREQYLVQLAPTQAFEGPVKKFLQGL